ncbi:snake venom serine protease rhinocerase 5-like [Eupeodes corollae]|uniref:snake venom serine protease rhinocerase 5-like n=1 Tax=Eupeodes corollae TaxID=290404 RepID=UPI00249355A0|nr:snake venom serine protease rhinocerase 5-like [Eupeodes corollae]
MVSLKIFTLFALTIITVSQGQEPTPRVVNGIAADTMRRFPHHVNIQPIANGQCQDALPSCSGSIIGKRWVLTSKACVENGEQLRLDLQRLNRNNSIGSYSTVVNNDEQSVTKYPTDYDDIALIKLPFELIYSPTVKPIGFSSSSPAQLLKKLVVLPGFDDSQGKDQLSYAMLNIASNGVCKQFYGDVFDEFLNMCAEQNNRYGLSGSDTGAGLIVGWPAKSAIIGVLSNIINASGTGIPSAYILIEKYEPWIRAIMAETEEVFITTTGYYAS